MQCAGFTQENKPCQSKFGLREDWPSGFGRRYCYSHWLESLGSGERFNRLRYKAEEKAKKPEPQESEAAIRRKLQ